MTEAIRHDDIGVVIIGRNEGNRLRRAIESVMGRVALVVYVDSGSSDGSVVLARGLSAHVVELDPSMPFTAGRGRNAGVEELRRLRPDVHYVQMMDGDCEIVEGWLEAAKEAIEADNTIAVVCGRRRERQPEASVYNRLINMEWNTPAGEAKECGGDALMRVRAFQEAGGFTSDIIAGEEPELCLRLRRDGWRIMRVDHDMTLHDARIARFGQWWKRAVRCGHAYAEARDRHGKSAERFRVDEVRSILEWALLVPVVALGLAWFTWGLSLLLFGGYLLLAQRIRRYWIRRGYPAAEATRAAFYGIVGKFAELTGIGKYYWRKMWNLTPRIIEYKAVERTNV